MVLCKICNVVVLVLLLEYLHLLLVALFEAHLVLVLWKREETAFLSG